MARKAPKTAFKKGDPRASAAGRKGSPVSIPELIEARKMTKSVVELALTRYLHMNKDGLKEAFENPETPAFDLVVIKIITEAIKTGDYKRLDFLMDRTIGRVKIEADITTGPKNVHAELMERMHGNQVIDVTNRSTDKS